MVISGLQDLSTLILLNLLRHCGLGPQPAGLAISFLVFSHFRTLHPYNSRTALCFAWCAIARHPNQRFRCDPLAYLTHVTRSLPSHPLAPHSLPTSSESGLLHSSPDSFKIPPFDSSSRRPANIPLHTLSTSSRPYETDSASLVGSPDEKQGSRRSSYSSAVDSDFSLFSDTGDLVDQLADEEDPLRIRLRPSLEEGLPRTSTKQRGGRQHKRVHYHSDVHEAESEKRHTGVPRRKEDIPIPSPPPRKISAGEKLLAIIMAPTDRPSRLHGLHGKKLM